MIADVYPGMQEMVAMLAQVYGTSVDTDICPYLSLLSSLSLFRQDSLEENTHVSFMKICNSKNNPTVP